MEPRDHQTRDREKIADQWLDAALKQYGEAEPRAGLEGRVLANLRAEKESLVSRGWNRPAVVAVAVVLVIGMGVFWASEHRGVKEITGMRASVVSHSGQAVANVQMPSRTKISQAPMPRRSAHRRLRVQHAETDEPRLAQFPAPRPLTAQEQLLVRYVRERPDDAKREAQAQTELFQQGLAEFEEQYGFSEHEQTHPRD